MAANFSWKGSVDSELGTATYYAHTEYEFSIEFITFKQGHAIANALGKAEVDFKRQAIQRVRATINNSISTIENGSIG